MRPRERRETGEQDLFRSRLDQIIDMKHSLVTLARTVDWGFLEREFGAVYTDGAGQPPLPTRLMAGLAILKRTYLGRVMRDISRKIAGDAALEERFSKLLLLARRVHEQRQGQRGPKVYSLHAPEVE